MKKKLKTVIAWATIIFCAVALISGAMAISLTRDAQISKIILEFFDDWSVALSAAAAVILAFVAYKTIKENRRLANEERILRYNENRRIRVQEAADDILDWTEEIEKILYLPQFKYNIKDDVKIFSDLQQLVRRGTRMLASSLIIGDELVPFVERIGDSLREYYSYFIGCATEGKAVKPDSHDELSKYISGVELILNYFKHLNYDYDNLVKLFSAMGLLPLIEHIDTLTDSTALLRPSISPDTS